MTLFVVTGETGNGKTAHVVDMLAHNPEFKGRPIFVSGIPQLKIDHLPCPEVSDWTKEEPNPDDVSETLQWFTFPPNSVLVIDEAWRVFPNRISSHKEPPVVQAIATHRRVGIDIILITQFGTQLDPNVRKHCKRHIHIADTFFGRYRYEWSKFSDPDSELDRKIGNRKRYKLPVRAFNLYKSSEAHTTIKQPVPWLLYVLGGALLVTAAIGVHLYQRFSGTLKPLQEIPISQTTHQKDKPKLDEPMDYVNSFKPRIAGLIHTAPRYDELTKPTSVPFPAGCYKTTKICKCFTVQGTPYETTDHICQQIVKNGIYKDFNEREDDSRGRAAASGRQGDQIAVNTVPS